MAPIGAILSKTVLVAAVLKRTPFEAILTKTI
jgi:hypothetical protein